MSTNSAPNNLEQIPWLPADLQRAYSTLFEAMEAAVPGIRDHLLWALQREFWEKGQGPDDSESHYFFPEGKGSDGLHLYFSNPYDSPRVPVDAFRPRTKEDYLWRSARLNVVCIDPKAQGNDLIVSSAALSDKTRARMELTVHAADPESETPWIKKADHMKVEVEKRDPKTRAIFTRAVSGDQYLPGTKEAQRGNSTDFRAAVEKHLKAELGLILRELIKVRRAVHAEVEQVTV